VAMSQGCPGGRERIQLLEPHTGKLLWQQEFISPGVRLLAVGTGTVALYRSTPTPELVVLGPDGEVASRAPCTCGTGALAAAGRAGDTLVLSAGPLDLVGVAASTGAPLWHAPVAGGGIVQRLVAQDDAVFALIGSGAGPPTAVNRVDGATGRQTPVPLMALNGAVGPYLLAQPSGAVELYSTP
jgi:outer membrane protein assembly factor BamB